MKILNVGDIHMGVRADDEWIRQLQEKFFDDAIALSKEHNIKTWIQYGDWFDTRKAVTQKCMNFAKRQVLKLQEAEIEVHVIIGNHDLYHKNKITPNSVSEILRGYPHIHIYEEPTTVNFDGVDFDLIPWMCDDNTSDILRFIKKTKSRYCVGHWELNGFWFYKGLKSHGIEPDFLKKYEKVYSGHFHTISTAANVTYIGTPFTLTAGDENDPRGVWIFDTEDESFELYENPTIWHRKIHYGDKINPEDFKNIAVRLFADKPDAGLSKLESKLEEVVHSLKTITNSNSDGEEIDTEDGDIDSETKKISIVSLGNRFIDSKADMTDDEKESTKILFKKLFIEAQSNK